MRELIFEIPGEPKAKARPRFTKKGFAYTPAETVNYENLVKVLALDAVSKKERWQIRGQFALEVLVFVPIPQSRPKQWQRLAEQCQIRPTTRPDWDNYGKIVSDALNGVVWHDDSMVVTAKVEKFYTHSTPGMRIRVTDITHKDDRWVRKG